ncbi:MAG: metal ABC transporter ATP-binding protein [Candidatus Woesearchaeota archaeon]|nr:metal ABC transporter ATP-binding protein [Candidatus Woesearchaeota archaeon]
MKLVEAKGISFSYGGDLALENISLHIRKGDFIGLIGPNGSGKTTLAKILVGLLAPTKGTVTRAAQCDVGYVPQRLEITQGFPGTVDEILSLRPSKKKRHLVKTLGITTFMQQRFADLSGGQQQRVLMALSLLADPKLLILDEPEVGVDVQGKENFYKMLKELNERQRVAIILITHDVGLVSTRVKRVICLNRNICCTGAPKETRKLLQKVYGEQFEVHHHRP